MAWFKDLADKGHVADRGQPLERTGILLPILPVFGFWMEPSQVSYSGLLFLVGLFYGALSVMRRSFSGRLDARR